MRDGWSETAKRFHVALRQAMMSHSGKTLKTSEIKTIVQGIPTIAEHAELIYPSDHCINHTNKGACNCSMTEHAIFERIRHGIYRVRNIA